MKYEIKHRPSFSLVEVELEKGEALQAESGAMVFMSPNIKMETKAKGGIFGALKRSLLAGESFFINIFKAERDREKWGLHHLIPETSKLLKLTEQYMLRAGRFWQALLR